jgi:nicotinamidase-related amidase
MSLDPHLAPHWDTAALVLIDVQRDFLSDRPHGVPGTTEILPGLARLCAAFRAAGRPIVHVVRLYEPDGSNAERVRRTILAGGAEFLAPGAVGREIPAALLPVDAPGLDDVALLRGRAQRLGPDEFVIYKPRWGAFYDTPLHDLLTGHGVDTIVFAGCNLPNCPRASMVEASERDYRIALATDAVSRPSDQGFAELAGIGVILVTTDTVVASVAGSANAAG